jgi:hypothetical protein
MGAMSELETVPEADDEELLPLDPTCPACGHPHDVGEVFDGSDRYCAECDAYLVCVTYTDGSARMELVRQPAPELTGRQRTRLLWERRGRR